MATYNETIIKKTTHLLRYTFTILPIAAGTDKFLNMLTDWTAYINPGFEAILPFSGSVFMMIVGVIEIIAGIIVFTKPKTGGLVVAAWLIIIALSLLAGWNHVDVAVRDLVMAIAAFSLSNLVKASE